MLKRRSRTLRVGIALEEWPELIPVYESDWAVDWEHVPVGPFRLQMWNEFDHVEPTWETLRDFDAVMGCALLTLGPFKYASAVVLDESYKVIWGYVNFSSTIAEAGTAAWFGCRAAYEWLERDGRVDALSLAVWESTAKDRGR